MKLQIFRTRDLLNTLMLVDDVGNRIDNLNQMKPKSNIII